MTEIMELLSLYSESTTTFFFTCFAIFAALYCWWKNCSFRRGLPPGPIGLPIVGYLPFLGNVPYKTLEKLAETYGPVFSFRVPGHLVIYLGNFEAIKEAFVRQANFFSGKPQVFYTFRWFMDKSGLTTAEGEMFTEQRRFLLHTLRDFGFGRMSLEERIHEVINRMLSTLESIKGNPYDIRPLLHNSTSNVISSLLFDKLYDMDDPEFVQQRKDVNTFFSYSPGMEGWRPWFLLKYLPWQWFPHYKDLVECKKRLHDFVDAIIRQHQETFDPDHLRDYVDCHLHKLMNAEKGSKEEKYFRLVDLRTIALNMFVGGTDTSANAMHWGLKLLATHQDVQSKIQEELDQVVGRDRLPSVTDVPMMPYTDAVTMEINRIACVVSLTPLHSTTGETTLFGYRIPKGSLVVANLHAAHMDPKYWPEPGVFNPENFLNAEGKVQKKESYVPFSLGKRYCPGDSLAKMEMFLFVSSILQRFRITLVDHSAEREKQRELKAFVGITSILDPYKISCIPR